MKELKAFYVRLPPDMHADLEAYSHLVGRPLGDTVEGRMGVFVESTGHLSADKLAAMLRSEQAHHRPPARARTPGAAAERKPVAVLVKLPEHLKTAIEARAAAAGVSMQYLVVHRLGVFFADAGRRAMIDRYVERRRALAEAHDIEAPDPDVEPPPT